MTLETVKKVFDLKELQLTNVESYEKPDFSISEINSGIYQKSYENWFNHSFGGKIALTKTYNQFRFEIFHTSSFSSGVVGNHRDLFQKEYIDEYLGLDPKYDYSVESNRVQLEMYVDKLEYIARKLEERGKVFIFCTTPTKCDFNYENIPYVYRRRDNDSIRGIDYIRELLKNKDIHYVDGYETIMEKEIECPIFYCSGIHWSRPAEQMVSLQILETIEEASPTNIKKIELKDMEVSDSPFWRDQDIWNMLNVWEKPEEQYYEYQTETVIPEQYMKLNILIQGGSFSQGCREDFINHNIADDVNYIFYNQYNRTMDGQVVEISYANQTDATSSD